ncbi:MAG: glycosyltransferase [Proteobacteria bacterium]|nr:MAG: glycosyltransferase [Pseudomonadota bacterium]
MRIAQIMLAKGFGGAERSFVDLCAALCARGHQVLAICERRAEARPFLEATDAVAIRTLTVRGPWDLIARRAIKRTLKRFGAEIVQLHLARAAGLAGPAAAALNIPTLAKTHNYVDLKYYLAVGHLVPTTSKQRAFLVSAGIPARRISLIPNFSAIAPVGPVQRDPRDTTLQVAAVGRLVYKKGFDVLLRAVANARQRGIALRCVIAGAGPERDTLSRLCAALELNDVVSFLGWQEDVAQCLAVADVFVLPSRDEPFGIVCLEAMALGVPIIATLTDGPTEILDRDTALLVERDNPDSLATAFAEVATNRAGAAVRAATAHERFNRYYSEEAVVSQYLALYADLGAPSD